MTPPNSAARSRARFIRDWDIWSQSRCLVAVILGIEALAITTSAIGLSYEKLTGDVIQRALVMLILSAVFDEATKRIDRLRSRLTEATLVDMSSVWTFAAAVVLPIGWATVFVVAMTGFMYVRHQRKRVKGYRFALNVSVIILAAQAAHLALYATVHGLHALPTELVLVLGLTVGLLVYFVVNVGVVLCVVYVAVRPDSVRSLLPKWDECALELAALCLGGLVAMAMVFHPWLAIFALPPMFTLQRSALVRALEDLASRDSKTGLLNAVAWQQVARRELARADRESTSAAVLLIDLDHFKKVNDSHGHMIGDAALQAVGRGLTRELREYDTVGRFGGEEFVAILPEVDVTEAYLIADRARAAISTIMLTELGATHFAPGAAESLSASIGLAVYPRHGGEVDELLRAADSALYVAKGLGRNRVEVADSGSAGAGEAAELPIVV